MDRDRNMVLAYLSEKGYLEGRGVMGDGGKNS